MKKRYGDSMKKEIIKAVRQMDGRTMNGQFTIEFIYGAVRGYLRDEEAAKYERK